MENWKQTDGGAGGEGERRELIAALIRERRGFEIHGDAAGMAEIDKQLKRLGHEAVVPSKRAEYRPASRATEKR